MVVAMARRNGASRHHLFFNEKSPPATLGILAFDAVKTMCRLVSLYKSLSDNEILKLRKEVIQSKGVVYLNSKEECLLLNLACAERLEELNVAAANVSRLGQKCSDLGLNRFDLVYADLKLGIIDMRKLEYGTRKTQKIIEKMEKLVLATSNLHTEMESLAGMEASERKVQRLRTIGHDFQHCPKPNTEYSNSKMASQKKQVQHYKNASLWNQTFDKIVGLMARTVCIIYARIFSVFGSYVSGLLRFSERNIWSGFSRPNSEDCCCLVEQRELYRINWCLIDQSEKTLQNGGTKSGPITKTTKTGAIRLPNSHPFSGGSGGKLGFKEEFGGDVEIAKNNRVLRMASHKTVGGSGLSLRYANVITFAERCLHAPATIGADARDALYEMLPGRLKAKVKTKLKSHFLKGGIEEAEGGEDGHSLAEGWRDAVEELMDWLSPVAHDTLRWQTERNLEKQRYDTKPTVLLLQTLHYSDLEKAEAAIVEVLVGLSCICWFEKRQSRIGREAKG